MTHSTPTDIVLVTGAGQGLGRAFCHALAREGRRVVVADINVARAQVVADEIAREGGAAMAVAVDVADDSSVREMAAEVEASWGAPTALVNNAAVFSSIEIKPFTEIPLDEWQRVLDVNVTGTFNCCRHLVPGMAAQGYGKVVNISSATVWLGRPGYLHYVTSKSALIGFTRALASEVGPQGVRVNAVTPGSIRTEIPRATIDPAAQERLAASAALRRLQTPEDLVGTVVFLTSSGSDFITGQTINVDGGIAFH